MEEAQGTYFFKEKKTNGTYIYGKQSNTVLSLIPQHFLAHIRVNIQCCPLEVCTMISSGISKYISIQSFQITNMIAISS